MKNNVKVFDSEQGFVLITAMLMLVVLSFVGFMAIRNSVTEIHVSTNYRRFTEAFYEADGGTEIGAELIEQSIACINGFGIDPYRTDPGRTITQNTPGDILAWWIGNEFSGNVLDGNINVVDSVDGNIPVWNNEGGHWLALVPGGDFPSDDNRDFYLPVDYAENAPHTNVIVEGETGLASGAAILMLMGYHGKGKGLAAGGTELRYLVSAQREGIDGSVSKVCSRWSHIIGQEGECIY